MNSAKDPSARDIWSWDWITPMPFKNPVTGLTELRPWLATGETITDFEVTVTKGDVLLDGTDETDGIVMAWIKGGTQGTTSWVTCHIVTSEDREDDRTHIIDIRER